MPVDLLSQADAPKRRGAPFAPIRAALGAVVGQPFAHVMEQKIGHRPDQLEALLGLVLQPFGHEFRLVAGGAADLMEHRLAAQHLRCADIAAGGHGKVAAVKGHQIQPFGVDLCPARVTIPMRGLAAGGLLGGAIAPCRIEDGGGNADVPRKGAGGLLADRRCAGFPAETAQHRARVLKGPDDLRPTRDAIAVGVFGVREGQDIRRRDRLQQAQTDHRRGHTGAEHRAICQGAIPEVFGAVTRAAQAGGLPIRQGDLHLFITHAQTVFRRMARHPEILQLPAIDRIGPRARGAVAHRKQKRLDLAHRLFGGSGDRDAQEHRHRVIFWPLGRMAAPVFQVATLAGTRVKERPQPVRGQRRRRRRDPELLEQPVADLKVQLPLERNVARGQRKRIGIAARADRCGPCRVRLKGFGPVEFGRGGGDLGDPGGLFCGAGDHLEMRLLQCLRGGGGHTRGGHREHRNEESHGECLG